MRSDGVLPAPGNARLRVDDDARLEQPGRGQRLQRQDGGRGVAAGARDQARVFELAPVALGQAVGHGQLRVGRMRVPPLPERLVAQAERSREVEHPGSARGERRTDFRGQRVRRRQEDGVQRRELIEVERLHGGIPDVVQRRDAARLGADRSHGGSQADRRMPGQSTDELHSGVPRSAGDTHPDGRISIHQNH